MTASFLILSNLRSAALDCPEPLLPVVFAHFKAVLFQAFVYPLITTAVQIAPELCPN